MVNFDMNIFNNLKKLFFLLIVIISVSCSEAGDQNSETRLVTPVTVAVAELRDLSDAFTVSSEVVAYKRSYVASRISGLVEEVNFEEGEIVRNGDIMAKIDIRLQQTELRRALAVLNEAEDVYERTFTLFESGAVSRADLMTAERSLEQARSEVERLELAVEFGSVRAPISGVVTARLTEAGNNIGVNERMFTVTDMSLLVIRPGISELNLAGLIEGMEVDVMMDVYPDHAFSGTIRRIFPNMDPVSGLFTVEVELIREKEQPVVRPGFLARIRFAAYERREVVSVPSESVVERNGERFLFLLENDDENVIQIPVLVGVQRDGYAEILDGIESGVTIVATNLDGLSDGSAVRVVGTFRRHGFRN
ncbi:MAG: efflux RND transporter periplasmic adaptor subunit [Balneolaceae bacterium]|nr:MAG: efflux RND transporter periplasmic adaptor subunit [Balneolaceae bacterium]